MEKRIRLTARTASKKFVADQKDPQTAIDLGKNRTYHKIDEYHTFKQTVNHELPDMRHEWKDNPRTETGHGIPKMAKVYMAAKKATKLAMMFLGEKAKEEDIEKQARAFMRMGDKALTASINRWATCQGDECEAKASPKDTEPEVKVEEETKACKAGEAPVEEPKACKAGDEAAEAPAVEIKDEDAQAPAEAPAEQADIDIPEDGGDDAIEFDEAETTETAADADLTACFAGDDATVEPTAPKTEKASVAHKVGVKKISGQPTLTRIAKKADELSGLWDKWENPDVR